MTQNINPMKKTLITALSVTLAFGIVSPASAQHCNVRKGDSMWKISKRYHVDFHELKRLNKHFKDLSLILPQDEVELPNGSEGDSTFNNSTTDNIKQGDNTATDRGELSQQLEVLNLVNAERKRQGLQELVLSHTLNGVAMKKAQDMRDKNYFSHTSPTYGSPFEMLQQFGVNYSYAGENIASGQKSAQQVMDDWLNSSGHRANILNPNYTELGVGYVEGGSYGTYWVQLFIKP